MTTKESILARLAELAIPCEVHEHAPAFSMADCLALPWVGEDVTFCKNLLLTPTNRSAYYLYVMPDQPFRTGDVSKRIGSSRLSFAPADCLPELLHLAPGRMSPQGQGFDEEQRITQVIDRAVRREGRIAFHPCDNTATVLFDQRVFFERVLPALAHEVKYI